MKTILIPTDFSENSINACRYALKFAQDMKAKVLLINAYQIPIPFGDLPITVMAEPEVHKISLNSLEELKTKLSSEITNVEIKLHAELGEPDYIIEKLYKRMHADIVIMGLQGISKSTELFIGSNTYALFNHAVCNIMAIPSSFKYEGPTRILVATEDNYKEKKTFLDEISNQFKSKVILFHVITENVEQVELEEKGKLFEGIHKQRLKEGENIEESIVNQANNLKANLIVMFPHRHTFFQRLFNRGNTSKVAQLVKVPLLGIAETN